VETATFALVAGSGYVIGDGQATASITDDDVPSVSVRDASVAESVGTLTVQIDLSTPPATSISIPWRLVNGSARSPADVGPASGTVTVPAGASSAVIRLGVVNDRIDEPTETLRVEMAAGDGYVMSDPSATVRIVDDDPPPTMRIAKKTVRESNRASTARFVVRLTGSSSRTVTAVVVAANGTAKAKKDFGPARVTIRFRPGSARAVVPVRIIGDRRPERTETFVLRITSVRGAVAKPTSAVITIRDDD
jgi:hypothetical protein